MTTDEFRPFRPDPLTTSVVGSHAHPGWLELAVAAAARGELGPAEAERRSVVGHEAWCTRLALLRLRDPQSPTV